MKSNFGFFLMCTLFSNWCDQGLGRRALSSNDYKAEYVEETPVTEPELQIVPEDQPRDVGPAQHPVKFANTVWTETWVLSGRNFYNTFRTKTLFISRIGIVVSGPTMEN